MKGKDIWRNSMLVTLVFTSIHHMIEGYM